MMMAGMNKARHVAHLAIIMAIILASCSPSKRMQRLIDKHPELSRTDTIAVRDTTFLPSDTIWRSAIMRDTVRVESDRQSVHIVRVPTGSPCDTAAIALDIMAEVKADTIYWEVAVPVDRIIPCPEGATVAAWWRVVALFFAVLCAALFLLLKYQNQR